MIRPAATLAIVLAAATALAQPHAPADEQPNAAEGYRYAWALMRDNEWSTINACKGAGPPPPEVVHALTAGPTPKAIRYALIATSMDYCEWPPFESCMAALPTDANLHRTARLLAADEARLRAGDPAQATRRTEALLGLASHATLVGAGRAPASASWRTGLEIANLALDRARIVLDDGSLPSSSVLALRRTLDRVRPALAVDDATLVRLAALEITSVPMGFRSMSEDAVARLLAAAEDLAASVTDDPTALRDQEVLSALAATHGAVVPTFMPDVLELVETMRSPRDAIAARFDETRARLPLAENIDR